MALSWYVSDWSHISQLWDHTNSWLWIFLCPNWMVPSVCSSQLNSLSSLHSLLTLVNLFGWYYAVVSAAWPLWTLLLIGWYSLIFFIIEAELVRGHKLQKGSRNIAEAVDQTILVSLRFSLTCCRHMLFDCGSRWICRVVSSITCGVVSSITSLHTDLGILVCISFVAAG